MKNLRVVNRETLREDENAGKKESIIDTLSKLTTIIFLAPFVILLLLMFYYGIQEYLIGQKAENMNYNYHHSVDDIISLDLEGKKVTFVKEEFIYEVPLTNISITGGKTEFRYKYVDDKILGEEWFGVNPLSRFQQVELEINKYDLKNISKTLTDT